MGATNFPELMDDLFNRAVQAVKGTSGPTTPELAGLIDRVSVDLKNSLPLTMTFTKTLPLLAVGGTYSFDVDVANAAVGNSVLLNPSLALEASLSGYRAIVSAAGKVTVKLVAGVAIAASTQTFSIKVIR